MLVTSQTSGQVLAKNDLHDEKIAQLYREDAELAAASDRYASLRCILNAGGIFYLLQPAQSHDGAMVRRQVPMKSHHTLIMFTCSNRPEKAAKYNRLAMQMSNLGDVGARLVGSDDSSKHKQDKSANSVVDQVKLMFRYFYSLYFRA